jgi:cytochrome bd ubiquinol oxidase subunit II
METIVTLALIGVIGLTIFMYVLLDGFDLGIGILFPFVKNQNYQHTMMNTILPIWDGNETWLVLGGATLYGAFPLVYSTLLPTLYLPIMMMLLSLILRGISFEFIHHAHASKSLWAFTFALGSSIAAFCQGVILGTFVQGYTYTNGTILLASHYHWLTPFSVTTGFAVVFGYALLGSLWLIAKTTGNLQNLMQQWSRFLLIFVAVFMADISLWTPYVDPDIWQRWFAFPNIFYMSLLPLTTVLLFCGLWYNLEKRNNYQPFLYAIGLFLCPFLGFILSLWPYIIPRSVTIWEAAAPFKVQVFILVGLAILLPVLIIYNAYAYWVFREKVTETEAHY